MGFQFGHTLLFYLNPTKMFNKPKIWFTSSLKQTGLIIFFVKYMRGKLFKLDVYEAVYI